MPNSNLLPPVLPSLYIYFYLHLHLLKLFSTLEITCTHRRNLLTNLEKKGSRRQTEYYFQYLQNTDWLCVAAMWVWIDVRLTAISDLSSSDILAHKRRQLKSDLTTSNLMHFALTYMFLLQICFVPLERNNFNHYVVQVAESGL